MAQGEEERFIIDNRFFAPEPQVWEILAGSDAFVVAIGVSGWRDDGRGPTTPIAGETEVFDAKLVNDLLAKQAAAEVTAPEV